MKKKELDFSSSICIRHGVFYDLDYFSEPWATSVINSIPLVKFFFDQNHKNVLLFNTISVSHFLAYS